MRDLQVHNIAVLSQIILYDKHCKRVQARFVQYRNANIINRSRVTLCFIYYILHYCIHVRKLACMYF